MGLLARRALHARLAGCAADPDLRARHLALSTDGADGAVAALLEEACGRAGRRGDHAVAAEYARHGVRLTPPDDPDSARRRALAEIENLAAAGEVSRALRLADRLVATLPPGPGLAEVLLQRSKLEDDDCETGEAFLLRALEEAGEDELLRGRVLIELGQLRFLHAGGVPAAIACMREALAIATAAGDPDFELSASANLAYFEALAGTPRFGRLERAVALEATATPGPLGTSSARVFLAKQLRWSGDLAAARSLLEAVIADERRRGYELSRPYRLWDLALTEYEAGNVARADALAREGIESARDAEAPRLERLLLYPAGLIDAWLGRASEARSKASRLLEDGARQRERPQVAQARRVLGVLALSEGAAAAAGEELAEAARLAEELGVANPGAFAVLPDAVEALASAGEHEAAAALLERLERQAERMDGRWAFAAVARCRGVLLLAQGAADDAIPHLAEAGAAFDRMGYRPDAARAVLARGRALLRAGHRTPAADALVEARDRFAAMGGVLWQARAVDDLERAAPGRSAGELTAAERRVAALVAAGRRNREIGHSLFMSVATVEAHLTRIYRKLEIRSRSELTRRVAEGSVPLSARDAP
jgi:DNA-binding CsgD family transcriptional regulator/tetratricopeptide (TPR) repeat protein